MKTLAIIPARGGSKRIPRKNIKDFLGKPLISYSIEAALESKIFDEVMVSTDNEEIIEIAKKLGAKIPFVRSAENADDFATTADVLLEVISCYKDKNMEFDSICCIYPTAPMLRAEKLRESYKKFTEGNVDTLISACRFSYPVQRSFKEVSGQLIMNFPEYEHARSQDLPPIYHDAGQFYWLSVSQFEKRAKLFAEMNGFFELSELDVQDIDNEVDWKIAELKYMARK